MHSVGFCISDREQQGQVKMSTIISTVCSNNGRRHSCLSCILLHSYLHRLMICLHKQTWGNSEEWVGLVGEVEHQTVHNLQRRQNGGGGEKALFCLDGSFGAIQKESCYISIQKESSFVWMDSNGNG